MNSTISPDPARYGEIDLFSKVTALFSLFVRILLLFSGFWYILKGTVCIRFIWHNAKEGIPMKTASSKKDLSNLMILYICFIVVMFLTSCFTSPLFPNRFGQDSAIFSLLGKGLLEGKDLYTDLFDHKGPMIFFLNALGLSMGGRGGIFLLQCLFGFVSLTILYFTAKQSHPERDLSAWGQCLFLFIAAYAVFFNAFEQGNLTEEYSIPAISLSLFLFVRYAAAAETKPSHPPVYAFVYGIMLAYLSFMRLNNAVTVCAGILAIFLYLLYKKEYQNLIANLLCGCAGLLVFTAPVLLYFHAHNSLNEMIYATFLHNFTIIGNSGRLSLTQLPVDNIVLYLPIILSGALFLHAMKEAKTRTFFDFLLGTIWFFNTLVLLVANRFAHYFAVFFPVYTVFLFRYCRLTRKKVYLLSIILCTVLNLLVIAYHCGGAVYRVYIEQSASARHQQIRDSFDLIPEQERDSVIGFDIEAADYLSGDVIPCYKYYTLQNTWSITNPQIREDFMTWVAESHPLWVLTTPEESNPQLTEILRTDYEYQFENPYLVFYRLKDAAEGT